MERERENVIELNDRPVIPLGRPTIHSAVALVFIGRVWGEEQEGSHKWESGNNNNNCLLACGHHCSALSVSILSFPQSVHLSLRRRNTQEGRTKSEMIITVSVPEMCVCAQEDSVISPGNGTAVTEADTTTTTTAVRFRDGNDGGGGGGSTIR